MRSRGDRNSKLCVFGAFGRRSALPEHVARDVTDRRGAAHLHGVDELVRELREVIAHPLLAPSVCRDHEGTAHQDAGGTDRKRPEHVDAAAYATVDENRDVTADRVDDLRERAANQDFEELFGFERPDDEDEEGRSDWHRITFQAEGSSTAVSGFSRVYDLNNASGGSTYDLEPRDEYKLSIAWDDGTTLEVSLKGLVEALPAGVTNESTTIEVPAEDLRVDVGDGRVLALSSASLEVEDGEPSLLAVEGLLLVP